MVEFFRKILAHAGSMVVRIGRPFDPFGNDVTERGESIDRAGRTVDRRCSSAARTDTLLMTISATPNIPA